MQRKALLLTLLWSLLVVTSCKKHEDAQPSTGQVSGTIQDQSNNGSPLAGVKVLVFNANTNAPVATATTDGNGNYSVSLAPGSYYIQAMKQGYDGIPTLGISAIPFTIIAGATQTNNYQMNKSPLTNTGYISGTVSAGGSPLAGVLVVALANGTGYASITDNSGSYSIYNVPAGSYQVQGWAAGYNSNQASTSVTSGAQSANVNLSLTSGASGSVTGSISFLATTNLEVDVTLVDPSTMQPIPGLSVMTQGGVYTIKNVPNGSFIARASYRNDGKVVDPDWLLKNGQPVANVSGNTQTVNFSVTGAVELTAPTNDSLTTQPFHLTSLTPTFTWQSYASTDDYVIEVTNENGKVIWGGFSGSGASLSKNISIPKSSTSVTYNADGKASEPLQAGHVYRWKIYASKNVSNTTPAWKLISASEDQRGIVAP